MKLTLGEKLKDERTKRKLTAKQVCEEIKERFGYTLSTGKYNEMENDIDKDFGYRAFIYLSKFYKVSGDYLLGLTENPSIDEDIINAYNITGLSKKAICKLRRIKKISIGQVNTEDSLQQIQNITSNIEKLKKDLSELFNNDPTLENTVKDILHRPLTIKVKNDDEEESDISIALEIKLDIMNLEEELQYIKDNDINAGKRCIDIMNLFICSNGFEQFLNDLSVYAMTDFNKNSKNIFSVVTNCENETAFVFNSSLIEQGLLAKIQQFISSLKLEQSEYFLTDIETYGEEIFDYGEHNPTSE